MQKFHEELSEDAMEKVRDECRSESVRVSSPDLEKILYKPFRVLDHGFVRVIDYMGTDSSIVQAARVSYGVGTKKKQEDRGLINYLMRHNHTTPFEMCEIKLHVKLPIFVMRHWVRHRTASVNEYSARYSVLSNEFYIPDLQQLTKQSVDNKQGRARESVSDSQLVIDYLKSTCAGAYEKYSSMLNDLSLTRELARTILPVNIYTEMYWKIDLHNLLHFLKLRSDVHAQYEIRCYANIILGEVVKKWVPLTYDAFVNYRQNSVSVPKKCLQLAARMIKGEKITQKESGLSPGEWQEFAEMLGVRVP
jgi:thymidylate synthase (FAD)